MAICMLWGPDTEVELILRWNSFSPLPCPCPGVILHASSYLHQNLGLGVAELLSSFFANNVDTRTIATTGA